MTTEQPSTQPNPTRNSQPGAAPEPEDLLHQIEELQSQLIHAQRLTSVGELASSITHEFNNILTTVINYAKMGIRKKDDATRDKAFDKILNASQRAAKITTGMLAYSRRTSNRQEPIDLAHLVRDVLVLIEKDLAIHRVGVDLDLVDGVLAAINPGQIQQVLMNLIVNARQAMQPGGRIRIQVVADHSAGVAAISVQDTGSGMRAEVLQRIFDPFFTTKTADQNGQGGTGLGLSLCRDIIEAHHGRIRVESTVGVGTTFTLKFPLVLTPDFVRTKSPEASQTVGA